jgi:hypothetical protein
VHWGGVEDGNGYEDLVKAGSFRLEVKLTRRLSEHSGGASIQTHVLALNFELTVDSDGNLAKCNQME